jgi:TPR repeat protein
MSETRPSRTVESLRIPSVDRGMHIDWGEAWRCGRRGALAAMFIVASSLQTTAAHAEACRPEQRAATGGCCAAGEMWDQRFARCVSDARASCIGGDYTACITAGDHYAQSGRSPDRTQAQAYYRRACEHGAAAGCTALGVLELLEAGFEHRRRAQTWFARGCDGAHNTRRYWRCCSALAMASSNAPARAWHCYRTCSTYRKPASSRSKPRPGTIA